MINRIEKYINKYKNKHDSNINLFYYLASLMLFSILIVLFLNTIPLLKIISQSFYQTFINLILVIGIILFLILMVIIYVDKLEKRVIIFFTIINILVFTSIIHFTIDKLLPVWLLFSFIQVPLFLVSFLILMKYNWEKINFYKIITLLIMFFLLIFGIEFILKSKELPISQIQIELDNKKLVYFCESRTKSYIYIDNNLECNYFTEYKNLSLKNQKIYLNFLNGTIKEISFNKTINLTTELNLFKIEISTDFKTNNLTSIDATGKKYLNFKSKEFYDREKEDAIYEIFVLFGIIFFTVPIAVKNFKEL